jgi:uncharacterized protein (DUF1810 family)
MTGRCNSEAAEWREEPTPMTTPAATPATPPEALSDPWNLARFVDAQAPVYDTVRAELAAGRKRSHWMWFVFPQLKQLGRSSMAVHFGLAGRQEAVAYLEHPLLGPRLRDCAGLVLAVQDKTAHEIFGSPDDLKLRSCMTLFAAVAPGEQVFQAVLDRCYGGGADGPAGAADEATLRLLGLG